MKGFLATKGIRVGQRQIAAVMPYYNPAYHRRRQANTAKLLNPIPSYASYFGHKLHVDQNEKMVMHEVTHICTVDGFSGKIVAFTTMPVKNTVEIYKHIFRYYVFHDVSNGCFNIAYILRCTCVPRLMCTFVKCVCMCVHLHMVILVDW